MKSSSSWAIRGFAVAALVIGIHAIAGNSQPRPRSITLCYSNQDARPWQYRQGGGLDFQLLDNASRQVGISLRYEAAPWEECLSRLRDNQVEGVFSAPYLASFTNYGVFPGVFVPDATKYTHVDRFVVIRRKSDRLNWDGKSITHLSGELGFRTGHEFVEENLRRAGATTSLRRGSPQDLLEELADGSLGGLVLLSGEAEKILEHNEYLRSRLEILPRPLFEKPYFLVFSRSFFKMHPSAAEEIWNAIEGARDSAAFRQLERRTLAALGQG